MMKRHRTIFPGKADFTGWWILSKRGRVAQLNKVGRNLHECNLYALIHEGNGQQGDGEFLLEQLLENGCVIRLEREDLKGPMDPMEEIMRDRVRKRVELRHLEEASPE